VTHDLDIQYGFAVIKVYVRVKFYQAKCSGSWLIMLTEKQTKTRSQLSLG